MKCVFISTASSKETLREYEVKYARNPKRFVQQWWDYSFAVALKKHFNEDLIALSFPPVSTFPSSKCIKHKSRVKKSEVDIYYPSMFNLPVIKQQCLISNIYKQLKNICKRYANEEIVILTHCIYMQSAVPAFKIKKKYQNVRVFSIVPDLPEHATAVAFDSNPMLKKIFSWFVKKNVKLSKEFDGYICFSEPQMRHLNQEKPHIVMEGFFDFEQFDQILAKDKHSNRIVYAGGLMYRYGIRELVDGFIKANINGAELYIYGKGEAEDYIYGKEQKGVFYGGCIDRNDMIAEEKSAFLLVNPRPTDEEYSKCSFPSKLMEYMASGTATLTSRLECISSEYADKMLFIDEVSEEGIAQALKYCFENKTLCEQIGVRAQNYIRAKKNVDIQAEKVADFLLSNKGTINY